MEDVPISIPKELLGVLLKSGQDIQVLLISNFKFQISNFPARGWSASGGKFLIIPYVYYNTEMNKLK